MARQYAKVSLAVWADDDFRQLSAEAQGLYFKLLTSPTLTLAGVVDWRPNRLAALTAGQTAEDVEQAAQELSENVFIVIDEDTEECLIRTFVKHDGTLSNRNIAAAMVKDYAAVFSLKLKKVLTFELQQLHESKPEMDGWRIASELLGEDSVDPRSLTPFRVSGTPSETVSGTVPETASLTASGTASRTPSVTPSVTASPTALPTESHIPQPSTLNLQPSTTEDKSSVESANAPNKKTRRATTLPADWVPNDKHADIAMTEGVHLAQQADLFRDHFTANGKTMKDWDAAFRNWLRRANTFNGGRQSQPAPRPAPNETFDPFKEASNGNPF